MPCGALVVKRPCRVLQGICLSVTTWPSMAIGSMEGSVAPQRVFAVGLVLLRGSTCWHVEATGSQGDGLTGNV